MKKVLALTLLLAVSPVVAQVGLPFPGPGTSHSIAAGYTGPGDIKASALFWVGVRGYSAATSDGTHKSVAVKRDSDSHTCDFLIDSSGNLGNTANCSTGGDNGSTCATWGNATTIRITTLYDPSGNARDFVTTTSTAGQQARLNCSPVGMEWFGTTSPYCTSGSFSAAQQSTASIVAKATTPVGLGSFVAYGGNPAQVGWNSANTWFIYDGSLPTFTASDSAYHALQAVFNGASSDAYIDGSSNTLNAGAGAGSSATACIGATNSGGTNSLTNTIVLEIGAWGSGFSSGEKSSMNSNQHTYWGF